MSSILSRHSDTTVTEPNNSQADSQKSLDLTEKPLAGLALVPEKSHPNVSAENDTASGPPANDVPEHEYPTGSALASITVALILAIFLVALDRTIISTAIPAITNEFHSLGDVGWYGSAYMITGCGFMPLSGKIYTFYSVKWVFLIQIAIFEIGSALCGWAPDSTSFIVGRAIAGAGSSGIFTGAILMVTDAVPLHKRSTFMGAFGGIFGLSSVIAPIMGGAFTEHVTWRWSFWINLPIGAISSVLIFFLIKATPSTAKLTFLEQINQLDPIGTALFLPSMICLLLALQWGGTEYPWSDGRVIALLVVFAISFIAFVAVQIWKQDEATMPPRIITQRSIASGMFFCFAAGAAMMVFIYYLPIWFQAIQGVSPTDSGVRLIPMVVSLFIGTMSAGIVIRIFGYYVPFMLASSVIMSIGAGMLTTIKPSSGAGHWIGYQVIYGLGLGFGMQQPAIAAQAVLERKDIPIGTSMVMFCQILGGAVFMAVAQNNFTKKLVSGLLAIGDSALSTDKIIHTGATDLKNVVGADLLPKVLMAYNEAIVNVFYVAVAMAAVTIVGSVCMEWVSTRKDVDKKEEVKPEEKA